MVNIYDDGERITLSALEIKILLALLLGQMGGYEIARQAEDDSGRDYKISNGVLYRALKSLKDCYLIALSEPAQSGKPKAKTYDITAAGREVLSWHITAMQTMISLARERSRPGRQ